MFIALILIFVLFILYKYKLKIRRIIEKFTGKEEKREDFDSILKHVSFIIDPDKLQFHPVDKKLLSYSIQRIVLTYLENIQFFTSLHLVDSKCPSIYISTWSNWNEYRKFASNQDLVIRSGKIVLSEHTANNTDHDLYFKINKIPLKLNFSLKLPSGYECDCEFSFKDVSGKIVCNLDLTQPYTANLIWQYLDFKDVKMISKSPEVILDRDEDIKACQSFLDILKKNIQISKGDFLLNSYYKIDELSDAYDEKNFQDLTNINHLSTHNSPKTSVVSTREYLSSIVKSIDTDPNVKEKLKMIGEKDIVEIIANRDGTIRSLGNEEYSEKICAHETDCSKENLEDIEPKSSEKLQIIENKESVESKENSDETTKSVENEDDSEKTWVPQTERQDEKMENIEPKSIEKPNFTANKSNSVHETERPMNKSENMKTNESMEMATIIQDTKSSELKPEEIEIAENRKETSNIQKSSPKSESSSQEISHHMQSLKRPLAVEGDTESVVFTLEILEMTNYINELNISSSAYLEVVDEENYSYGRINFKLDNLDGAKDRSFSFNSSYEKRLNIYLVNGDKTLASLPIFCKLNNIKKDGAQIINEIMIPEVGYASSIFKIEISINLLKSMSIRDMRLDKNSRKSNLRQSLKSSKNDSSSESSISSEKKRNRFSSIFKSKKSQSVPNLNISSVTGDSSNSSDSVKKKKKFSIKNLFQKKKKSPSSDFLPNDYS